jgi:hypothetical protein
VTAAPSALAVLRHALADPLSAATAKVEVLTVRLLREAPAFATRAQDLGADLATAGRLLDLLSALSDIAEERPEPVPIGRLVAPFGQETEGEAGARLVRVRPASAEEAIRRVVAFGAGRGGAPVVAVRRGTGRAEVRVDGLGPLPPVPIDRLVLLPREVPGADDLFFAHAAVAADGGEILFSVDGDALGAALSWPWVGEAP